eukprot:Tbor_TRINITY_DN5404_c5_g1::TRINITY_DN5404_c5_g1_i1::g.24739::m.24739
MIGNNNNNNNNNELYNNGEDNASETNEFEVNNNGIDENNNNINNNNNITSHWQRSHIVPTDNTLRDTEGSYTILSREDLINNIVIFLDTHSQAAEEIFLRRASTNNNNNNNNNKQISQKATPIPTNPHGHECLKRCSQTEIIIPKSQLALANNNNNIAHPGCGDPSHYIYCTSIPNITTSQYLLRLTEYFRTTDAVFLSACHYFNMAVGRYYRNSLCNNNLNNNNNNNNN